MKNLGRLSLMISLLITIAAPIHASQNPSRPDITGGAALIFNRPENPKSRSRDEETSKQRSSKDEKNDQVEDAIELGNAARDRKPPDFESAEKAYRLASKLNPRDARPYVGLGNIFWDQRRFAEAAKAYREAVRFMYPKTALWSRVLVGSTVGIARADPYHISGVQIRVYLAATLLEEQNAGAAERELRATQFANSDKPEWHALLGYSLSIQGRHSEAAESYKRAVELAPLNSKYKELFEAANANSRRASANDPQIRTQLQNTSWQIRDATNSTIKGACKLTAKASLECSAGVPFAKALWTVRDGLIEIKKVNDRFSSCIGQMRGDSIEVRCYESDASDVWTRLRK